MLARSGHPETAGLTKLIKLYDPNYDRYFHQRAQLEISLNAPTYRTDLKQRANQSEIVAYCIPTMDMTAVAHQGVNRTTSPALKMEIQLYAIQLLQKMRQDDNNDLQIDHTAIMESIELIGDGNWDMVFSRVAGWNRSILGKQNTYMMVARNSAEADDLRNAIRHIKVQNTDYNNDTAVDWVQPQQLKIWTTLRNYVLFCGSLLEGPVSYTHLRAHET